MALSSGIPVFGLFFSTTMSAFSKLGLIHKPCSFARHLVPLKSSVLLISPIAYSAYPKRISSLLPPAAVVPERNRLMTPPDFCVIRVAWNSVDPPSPVKLPVPSRPPSGNLSPPPGPANLRLPKMVSLMCVCFLSYFFLLHLFLSLPPGTWFSGSAEKLCLRSLREHSDLTQHPLEIWSLGFFSRDMVTHQLLA